MAPLLRNSRPVRAAPPWSDTNVSTLLTNNAIPAASYITTCSRFLTVDWLTPYILVPPNQMEMHTNWQLEF